ncbi:hypothetical protein CVT24_010455 [Panaeolus cyanescens]|uniref:F-box domain-containing protein n=1 Tax=Panaeolus cyanescens TaxID=181874 RepID=A0A409YQF8_9AGAR|nr:hypothetical protein CVT24_010455 [Panaeolus cyanescens]
MCPRNGAESKQEPESEYEYYEEEKENIKKRKRTIQANEEAPAPKKTKGKGKQAIKGKKQTGSPFLDLPFDVHLEICSYLGPTNLLNLARTCRDLHQLAASKDFDLVWRNLRKSRFPDMPECPDDMTEPAFFELCFGRGCLVCGNKPTPSSPLSLHRQWEIRTRICLKCVRARWTKDNPFHDDSRNPSDKALAKLRGFVPCVMRPPSSLAKPGKYYYDPRVIEAWKKEFKSVKPSDVKTWIAQKITTLDEIKLHSERCEDWHKANVQAVHDEEDKEILDGRMETILAYIRSIGWGDEMDRQTHNHPRSVKAFAKICMKKITPKVLEYNREAFERHMEWAQERRMEIDRSDCIKRRLRLFKNIYETKVNLLIAPEDPRPRLSDVFAIPRFSKRIVGTSTHVEVSAADFQDLENNLKGVIEEAKDILKQKMLTLVQEGMGNEPYDPETVLDLATTVFCQETLIQYEGTSDSLTVPEAMSMHVVASDLEAKSQLVERVLGSVPWNTGDAKFKFDKAASDMLGSLLVVLGLDPKTTTLREIEELDPIFECVQCNHRKKGRLVLKWTQTMKHLKEMSRDCGSARQIHQSLGVAVFEVLQGEDVTEARLALKNQHQRWLSSGAEVKPDAICRHCPGAYSVPFNKMLRHLNKKHGIAAPHEGDYKIVFQNDVRQFSKMECRLLAPRSPSTSFLTH